MKHTDTVCLDIETIPSENDWVREFISENTTPPKSIKKQESIDAWYAEKHALEVDSALEKCSFDGAMNHIICISAAVNGNDPVSFFITDTKNEADNIRSFYDFLNTTNFPVFVGHNISGFDIRVLRQRSIVLGIQPPTSVPFSAKPWDMNPFDTMVQWDAKNMTSLDKIAKALGLAGKTEVDGSMVWQMWKDERFKEIAEYCSDDVRLVREVYKKMKFINEEVA